MRIVMTSLCLLACAGSAVAQTAGSPPVLDQVYACASLTESEARLACYDAAVGRLREAQGRGDLVAVDRAQAQQIERESFGFSLPSLPRLFGSGGNDEANQISEVTAAVARVRRNAEGKAVITLDNGQVWTQIDVARSSRVEVGGIVHVRHAALGSFMMSVEAGGPALRVRRTQ